MLIQHIGHAEFYLETESGYRIATDPYDSSCGYPVRVLKADAALVSHGHHDHNAVENLAGLQAVIDRAGEYTLVPGIRVTAVRGYHDDAEGTKRGETLLFLVEAEGLRIVHLGDLGCPLNDTQAEILKKPDVLMIPVGGFFTIDGRQAAETTKQLQARIVLPMHYKTAYNSGWPISGPEDFLEHFPAESVMKEAGALRVTAGDLTEQPRVVLFR